MRESFHAGEDLTGMECCSILSGFGFKWWVDIHEQLSARQVEILRWRVARRETAESYQHRSGRRSRVIPWPSQAKRSDHIEKRMGPSPDPCGTPVVRQQGAEPDPLQQTWKVLPDW